MQNVAPIKKVMRGTKLKVKVDIKEILVIHGGLRRNTVLNNK